MQLKQIQDFQRFTSFDLNCIHDPSLHQDLGHPMSLIHLYEVQRNDKTSTSFDQLNLHDALSIVFNIYENDTLCAVIHFPDGYKLVQFETLPDGAYTLLSKCTNLIFGDYIDSGKLEVQSAVQFRFNVLLNLLETRFFLNTHCNATDSAIHRQIAHYFELWMKSPIEV